MPRADLDLWASLCEPGDLSDLPGEARTLLDVLLSRGASFQQDLVRASGLLPSRVDDALVVLIGRGLVTCDAFSGLRALFGRNETRTRHGRRRNGRIRPSRIAPVITGRWSLFRDPRATAVSSIVSTRARQDAPPDGALVEFVARRLLARTGVVFKSTIARERLPIAWRDLLRCFRRLEARGEIHGGRFVAGFHGEQYALPEAVRGLRATRKLPEGAPLHVDAADPLNYVGILTPEKRIASNTRRRVDVVPASN